jgi:isoquinoline 1-oxidoreductase beta subunit
MLRRLVDRPSDRREVLRLALGAGAGLVLGAVLPAAGTPVAAGAVADTGAFNPFVRIGADSTVTVIVKHLDKGQGIASGLATLIAEELDADWVQITTEFAPADVTLYGNLDWGGVAQGTGGSTGISNSFLQYRTAGAAARQMIVAAAARRWKLAEHVIRIEKGVVTGDGRRASFGELVAEARQMPVPASPPLKAAKDFVYIGKSFPRVDQRAKSTGALIFTQDVRLPGMLTAVVAHSPRFGGTVRSYDDSAALKVNGVLAVRRIPQGVAVLARSTFAAIKGREALKVAWDDSRAEVRDSAAILGEYRRLAGTPGRLVMAGGEAEVAIRGAARVIEADYVFPFLAHAAMEPMNAVVKLEDGRATVWTGSQLQTVDQIVAASVLGLKPDQVAINTLWAGGSFGRRAVPGADYVAEAAAIAKAWGRPDPVKLVWTREDDMRGGYYRPMYLHRVRVGLDAGGRIVGWHHRIVGQSILAGTPFERALVKGGIDPTSVEGVSDTPYELPAVRVELHTVKLGVPPLWWRSVGHTHTAYVVETLLDECARAAGADPVAYRLSLLTKSPRQQAVLRLAAEKAGWGRPLPPGVARGIAVHASFGTYVAEVAEVRMAAGRPKVDRVVAAVDCGIAVNPDNIRSQIEGAIGYGLGAALASKVTLSDGVVVEDNFDSYEVLRYTDMPAVEVHIVASEAAPKGIGEPGVPPIAPAVANAVAELTGRRVRVLPFSDGLKA